jgi:RimK family alpha-L-glutamate ligase
MTHLIALVSGFGWHVQDLRRAADRLAIEFTAMPFPELTGRVGGDRAGVSVRNTSLSNFDGVLVRMMPPGSLEQVVFRMDTLHRLAAAGVPVMNSPGAIEASVDKYLTLAKIEGAGLKVPTTWCGESAKSALAAFQELGRDVVVKPLFGSEGRGLVRVTDLETARRIFHALERIGSVLYLQKYIPNSGSDLRVFVLGERILGAIRRFAPSGDWRTNVAVGGRAVAVSIDSDVERLALQAARAVGARMAGVDLLEDRNGELLVLEVNAVPGWKALSSATGVDVASEILKELQGWHDVRF